MINKEWVQFAGLILGVAMGWTLPIWLMCAHNVVLGLLVLVLWNWLASGIKSVLDIPCSTFAIFTTK